MATIRSNRGPAGLAVALLLLALIDGCESRLPSGSPGPSASPVATAAPSGAPAASAAAAAAASIELHALERRFVPNALRSANGQVLWSARHGELWRFVPGTAQPERLFASANPDAAITDVVASSGGYSFVETSPKAYGDGGWRVWYLAGAGQEPVELDRGRARNAGAPPTLAMDDARVVWAGFDEPDSGWVSRLRMAALADLGHPITLLSYPVRKSLLWYPCLHGSELWFGIIHPDFDDTGAGNEFHIETLDLSRPQDAPVRFAGSEHDFNPAVNDQFVVWKTAEGDSAALNWGTIHIQERGAQAVQAIPIPNGNRPSIGDRFVAFDEITHTRLAVYDPTLGRVIDLGASGPDAPTYGGLSVSGNLLTWFTQGPDLTGLPQIGWAILPDE